MDSMEYKKNISETYKTPGYEPINVNDLDGYICNACGDGIYSIKSEKKINSSLASETARQNSSRIVAADLVEVDDVAKILSVSRQRIHQMMDEGKISYVYVGKKRFPVRQDNDLLKKMKSRITRQSKTRRNTTKIL